MTYPSDEADGTVLGRASLRGERPRDHRGARVPARTDGDGVRSDGRRLLYTLNLKNITSPSETT